MLEATGQELFDHTRNLNHIVEQVCGLRNVSPLISSQPQGDWLIGIPNSASAGVFKAVTTDLGQRENAIRLPIPDAGNARYSVSLHEHWARSSKKFRFLECALRLYVGHEDEDASQVLRLEWVAPVPGQDGEVSYVGKHANPHWHVDRSALVGPAEHWRSLDALTRPVTDELPLESFRPNGRPEPSEIPFVHDCSWLQAMHLPAQAQWMNEEWDGDRTPAPHQCQPSDLAMLTRWWNGVLSYLAGELPR